MKLARVDHIRCDSYDATTLVWIEDSMTEEQFQAAVDRAMDAYLKAVTEYMADEKPVYSSVIDWEKHRDRLVGDLLAEREAGSAKYAEWDKKRRLATGSFDTFLALEDGIEAFWGHEFAVEGEAYWGHRHGQHIEYGETEWPKFKLLKQVHKRTPGGRVQKVSTEDEWWS